MSADNTRSDDAAGLRIQLLGGFRVWVGSRAVPDAAWRRRKASSLIKLLALAPGHRLNREQVVDLLWPDLEPGARANNLHRTLHVARRALEPSRSPATPPAFLRLEGDVLALSPARPVWVDVEAFEAAAAAVRRSQDLARYEAAVALYTGELLPEDRYEDWAVGRREALRREYLALLTELARMCEVRGDYAAGIAALQRAVVGEPAHEAAHVGLMRLYALAGQRHEALRQYQQLREALRRELEAEPAPASRRLYEDIAAGRFPADTSAS